MYEPKRNQEEKKDGNNKHPEGYQRDFLMQTFKLWWKLGKQGRILESERGGGKKEAQNGRRLCAVVLDSVTG